MLMLTFVKFLHFFFLLYMLHYYSISSYYSLDLDLCTCGQPVSLQEACHFMLTSFISSTFSPQDCSRLRHVWFITPFPVNYRHCNVEKFPEGSISELLQAVSLALEITQCYIHGYLVNSIN